MESTNDQRVVNNVMRHEYKVLSENEKAQMKEIKDVGLAFHDLLHSLGQSRELSIAKTKIEEAVMWAVKHLTMPVLLLLMVTGCASKEKLDIFHRGNEIVQRHHISSEWDIAPSTHETLCTEASMVWSTFWSKKVCPGELDKNASMGVTVAHVGGASYKDLVVPAAISGAFQFGGFVAFAKLMPETKVNVRNINNTMPGARFSTGYFNATPAPAWLGQ